MIRRSLALGKDPLWAHRLPVEDLAALVAVGLIDEKRRIENQRRKLLQAARGASGGESGRRGNA